MARLSLTPPAKVQKLQTALHAKAKGSPAYRFYALYDKVYRADVLGHAYACCKANRGAAGVDEQTFEHIEAYGLERWLGELTEELTSRRWAPRDTAEQVARLNRMMVGWGNYFCLGPVSRAYAAVDRYARYRLRQWLCAKHKVNGRGRRRFPARYLHQVLGLVQLQERTSSFPWANA